MSLLLGIDPGIRYVGAAIYDDVDDRVVAVASFDEHPREPPNNRGRKRTDSERIVGHLNQLQAFVDGYEVDAVACEEQFVNVRASQGTRRAPRGVVSGGGSARVLSGPQNGSAGRYRSPDAEVQKKATDAMRIGAFRGAMIAWAWAAGIPCIEVSPTAVKRALTGTNNAPKDAMIRFAKMRFGVDTNLDHIADAIGTALAGVKQLALEKLGIESRGGRNGDQRSR